MSVPQQGMTVLALAALIGALAARVQAENIDPNNQGDRYAWGENVGWINFKPSQGPGVTVTSVAVIGFAWAENVGWINLSPIDGGVKNDGFGQLSGFAWGENVGWINFAPEGGGVTIAADGRFLGFAWGENIGWINFSIPSGVRTSFMRPTAAPVLNGWGILLSLLALALIAFYSARRSAQRSCTMTSSA
jgi:hypothetical protein